MSGREASRARGTLAQRQGGLVFSETGGAKAGLAEGSARGWPGGRAGGETATNGVSRGGDGGDGILVNNSKFQSPVR